MQAELNKSWSYFFHFMKDDTAWEIKPYARFFSVASPKVPCQEDQINNLERAINYETKNHLTPMLSLLIQRIHRLP